MRAAGRDHGLGVQAVAGTRVLFGIDFARIVRASLVKLGSFDRDAQRSQPSRIAIACSGESAWNTARSCSFNR